MLKHIIKNRTLRVLLVLTLFFQVSGYHLLHPFYHTFADHQHHVHEQAETTANQQELSKRNVINISGSCPICSFLAANLLLLTTDKQSTTSLAFEDQQSFSPPHMLTGRDWKGLYIRGPPA